MPEAAAMAITAGSLRERRSGRGYAALALLAATLTLVVIAASAYLRHASAGLSCADWPACYARVAGAPETTLASAVRSIHRVAALGVSLCVLGMVAAGFRRRTQRRWALAALALVTGLAALGLATAGSRLPAIGLANLLGGFALLAVLAAAHASAGAAVTPGPVRALAAGALAMCVLQAALGGLIATQSALLACPSFPGCELPPVRDVLTGQPWNPMRTPDVVAERIVAPSGASLLHLAHRINALFVTALVVVLAVRLWRPRGELTVFLGASLAVAVGAGIAAALAPSALGFAVVHNAAAALLVALLARAVFSRGGPPLPGARWRS